MLQMLTERLLREQNQLENGTGYWKMGTSATFWTVNRTSEGGLPPLLRWRFEA
jgi:hypothetical protein